MTEKIPLTHEEKIEIRLRDMENRLKNIELHSKLTNFYFKKIYDDGIKVKK